MPEFRTIKEVEAELVKYVPMVREVTGKNITLQRIQPLMKRLGNPERKLKIVHVAGTSGKTSTSYYLAAMLQASVAKVGLTVSPHVDHLTERFQVNGQLLDEATFCAAFGEFMEIVEGVDPEPSYFELLIGFAYWYFVRAGMDWVVIETGFGGTHDGTNVAQGRGKVCVITDIGMDHMKILGNTLIEIANQKSGIIHKGNEAYMYEQVPEVNRVFRSRAVEVAAEIRMFEQESLQKRFVLPGLEKLPLYQQRNWLLARAVYNEICGDHDLDTDQAKLQQSLTLQVPGRMDIWQTKDKTLVMDGAHNEQKMQAFVDSFREKYPDHKAVILLSLKEGKEYQTVLPLLQPLCTKLIITTFNVLQDLPSNSIDPQILADAAIKLGYQNVQVIPETAEALETTLKAEGDLAIITGSFYLLSVVRPLIIRS